MPNIKAASNLVLLAMILLITVGAALQIWNLETGILATQWLIILPLALLYLRKHNLRLSIFVRIAPLKKQYIPVIVVLAFSSWIVGMFLGTAVAELLSSQGLHIPQEIIPYPETTRQLTLYFLGMVVSASICEEIFFRGTIMPTIEQQGPLQGVVFSAFLFALVHLSILSVISIFILGLLIGVVVIKTRSLWAGVLLHALHNSFSVFLMHFSANHNHYTILSDYVLILPVLAVLGLWLGLRRLHFLSGKYSIMRSSFGWLPKGWFNWATAIILVIFSLGIAVEVFIYSAIG